MKLYVILFVVAIIVLLPSFIKNSINKIKNFKQKYSYKSYDLWYKSQVDGKNYATLVEDYERLLSSGVHFYLCDAIIPLEETISQYILNSKDTKIMLGLGEFVKVWHYYPINSKPTICDIFGEAFCFIFYTAFACAIVYFIINGIMYLFIH